MPKVLLIIPPCFTNRELDFEIGFPVNLALLGDAARAEGWDVEYLDMTLEEKEGFDSFLELDRKLRDGELKIVGISNHTVRTSVTTQIVAKRAKFIRPDVKVIVGGVNATFMTQELLESCPSIDYILRGYAQPGFRLLLKRAETDTLTAIPGLAQIKSGTFNEEPLGFVTPDDFATPSFQGLDISRYLEWTTTYPLLTHTGCGFSCNFCTSVMPGPYQNKEVYRPLDDVLCEMQNAVAVGFERFFMSANVFTSRKQYCLDLCDAIRGDKNLARSTWVCMTRVELVDHELLQAMRGAGCINVAFGVETAGRDQWRSLRKGRFSESAIVRAFDLARDVNIGTTAYIMVGGPSQTPRDIDSTIELLREVDPDYTVLSFFQPFPGTPYWKDSEAFGLSEIVPLDQWNFHEAPICRTKHMDKQALETAAIRLYLDRSEHSKLNLDVDVLEATSTFETIQTGHPALVYASRLIQDQSLPIRTLLDRMVAQHGSRGKLIALYWLSTALRTGYIKIGNQSIKMPGDGDLASTALTSGPVCTEFSRACSN